MQSFDPGDPPRNPSAESDRYKRWDHKPVKTIRCARKRSESGKTGCARQSPNRHIGADDQHHLQ